MGHMKTQKTKQQSIKPCYMKENKMHTTNSGGLCLMKVIPLPSHNHSTRRISFVTYNPSEIKECGTQNLTLFHYCDCRDPGPGSGPVTVLICGYNNKHMNIHSFNFPQVSAVRISHTLAKYLHWCGSV